MEIEIIDVPPGEAPIEIRSKWVGLRFPLISEGERKFRTIGVLSGPKTWLGRFAAYVFGRTRMERGYAVNSVVAIDILEKASPEAAEWWKNNTVYYRTNGAAFVFQSHVCQRKPG